MKNEEKFYNVVEMGVLLINMWVKNCITFDLRLSYQEMICLYLISQGRNINEIANRLDITIKKVKLFKKTILRKLACENINTAIAIGIKYSVP